ncbi:MAG: serine/threonine protein kinase [Myxococcota bacterium]|nr:serine/threonine protein kinase [Myxococcota bacterium]
MAGVEPIEQTNLGIPDRIARFRVVEKLGDDAFGTVYAAEDDDRTPVRLRVLPESVHLDPARRAQVIEDAKAAMQVEHPGLATVLDVGEGAQGLFIATTTAPRRTLRAYVEQRGKLDLAEALRLGNEIASAMAAAHQQGVVHGALADDRVMVADDGRATIVDLGLVELTRPAAHRPIDARTDVYAIAAMLHEMITGTRVSTNEMSSDPPERLPRLDASRPGIPATLVDLIERSTASDPAQRPADADRLLAGLTAIDLPSDPIGQQMADARADVQSATSPMWIVGASIAIAMVITLALVLVISGG